MSLIKEMLDAGVHYGHNRRYSNPKMKSYIYCTKNKLQVFDLNKVEASLHLALEAVKRIAQENGTILFVGTKRQAKQPTKECAIKCNMPYVSNRWLGGTLTNHTEVFQSVKRLRKLQNMSEKGQLESFTNKEVLDHGLKIEKLTKNIGGIISMKKLPDMLFVIDAKEEAIAIKEAKNLHIPVVAVVDSNSSYENIDYVIPGNDDSLKAINLYLKLIGEAILNSKNKTENIEPAKEGVQ